MTPAALEEFRDSDGWEVGVDGEHHRYSVWSG